MFAVLNTLPLLALPLIFYNFVAFASGVVVDPSTTGARLSSPIATMTFPTVSWTMSGGDLFTCVALFLLFFELRKATRTDSLAIINHGMSMLVSVACIIEFISLRGFATSVFFALLLMTIFDVVAGFTITIVAAKRDFGSSAGIVGTN